jgi:hypothetical protein
MFGSSRHGGRRPTSGGPRPAHGRPADFDRLEPRAVPAALDFSAGALTYEAGDGEANNIVIDRATVGGVNYFRIREQGTGVAVTASGAGLIADGGRTYRVRMADLLSFTAALGDGVDRASYALDALPPAAIIDAGDDLDGSAIPGEGITLLGTAGDDPLQLDPARGPDGWKYIRLTRGTRHLDFGRFESLRLDISQNGNDAVTVDRSIVGPNRPLAFTLVGGGTGDDSLTVTSPGMIPQKATITDGQVRFDDDLSGSNIYLGRSDNVAIDQPKVQIEVIRFVNGQPVSMGPTAFNTFLLDTGATGILATANPTAEMMEEGYQTDGLYDESGVSGSTTMDVSKPYRVDFAGESGERNTLSNVRILSSLEVEFSFFGPWGIVGMPAMVNRVTTVDMSRWANIQDIEDLPIKVDFGTTAPPNSGHLYHVPLQLEDFPASGQHPGSPVPTFAPLPFLNVKLREDGVEVPGRFLLDTGAQLSIISTQMAIALGLDRNHNGTLDDEALDTIEVSGIGGTTTIPLVAYDRIAVPTAEGKDLIFTDMLAGVIDIDTGGGPEIAGVFGMDFLTSGWAAKVLPLLLGTPGSDVDGYFRHVYFDFRNATSMTGSLVLDVTPIHDVARPALADTLTINHTGINRVAVAGGDGNDLFLVTPSTVTPIDVDGGPHVTGDTLRLVPPDPSAVVGGGRIQIAGKQDITFRRVETIDTGGTTASGPVVTGFTIDRDTGLFADDRVTTDTTLTLRVSFDKAATWTAAGVRLTDPNGATLAPTSIGGSGTQTLTVVLPALSINGAYTLRLDAGTFRDANGNPLGNGTDFVGTFTLDTIAPKADIVDVKPDPRFTPVDTVTIVFTEPVSGFDLADLVLTRNGVAVALPGSATLATADQRTWTLTGIGGAATLPGTYVLTLNATGSGIKDLAGKLMTASASDKFVINAPPRITVSDPKVKEGATGTTRVARFTIQLSKTTTQTVTLTYATANGTASAGSDYQAIAATTLAFAPGETSKTVEVTIFGDAALEPDETFRLVLSNAANATLGETQGVGTILNDDASLSVSNVGLPEGNSGTTAFTFTIRLSAVTTFPVTVQYSTANGTALAGEDYSAIPWTDLTFAAGETAKSVTVLVNGDLTVEPNETFKLKLRNATNAAIATAAGTGTIRNDDVAALRLAGRPGRSGAASRLTTAALAPIVDAAMAQWAAAGADVAALRGVAFRVTDLPGRLLGLATPRTIWIDRDAAGRGWFVDPTPGDSSEFRRGVRSPARGHVDLLSVVAHELGHRLGLDDDQPGVGVMEGTLGVGQRRLAAQVVGSETVVPGDYPWTVLRRRRVVVQV